MKKKSLWLVISLVLISAFVFTACQPAPVEEAPAVEEAEEVVEEEAQKDAFALKVNEDYKAFQAQTAIWGKMSEKVYWNTMA